MAELEHWPEQRFDEAARAFLFESSIRSIAELREAIAQQESKAAVMFSASVVIAGAGGWAGHLRIGLQAVPLLTLLALMATLAAFACALKAFGTRDYSAGVHPRTLADSAGATREQLRDASLEVLVDVFDETLTIATEKGRWLGFQQRATVVQAVLVFLILATR